MSAVEKAIGLLKTRRVTEAVEGLTRPQGKDSFELGRLSGIQAGLAIALQVLDEVLGEDDKEQTSRPVRRK